MDRALTGLTSRSLVVRRKGNGLALDFGGLPPAFHLLHRRDDLLLAVPAFLNRFVLLSKLENSNYEW